MYNVRIFKYPDGWQVRVYSRPVGFCDDQHGLSSPCPMSVGLVLDDAMEEWEEVRCNPLTTCIEPFTYQLAHLFPDGPSHDLDRDRTFYSSITRTKSRIYYLSRSNVWDWFITLTFNSEKVDSFDYDNCVKKLSSWLCSVRRLCPGVKYIMVPEQHKSGRFHFHGLFAGCDGLKFTDSGHKAAGEIIYNVGSYKLGWSTATRVRENKRVVKYLCKYITKELCQVTSSRKRYWASRNLDEAEIEEYLLEGTERAPYTSALETLADWYKETDNGDITVGFYELPLDPDPDRGWAGADKEHVEEE